MSEMDRYESDFKKKKSGIQGAIWSAFAATVWGLFIGIVINFFIWHHEGYAKLMNDMDITYQHQVHGISLRNQTAAVHEGAWIGFVFDHLNEWKKFSGNKIKKKKLAENDSLTQPTNFALTLLNKVYYVSTGTFKILIAKFLSVFSSIWVFIFAALIGGIDGLLKRYIRTIEAGRESTYIFHRVSDFLIKIPVGMLFLYLTLPIFIRPELVALLMSVTVFLFCYTATSNLKKFL